MMDRNSRFWNRIARRYAARPVADEAAYQRKLAITREYLEAESNVLEIGCGTGTTAIAHAPFVHRIRAVDSSPQMLDIARDRARVAEARNIEFECAAFDDVLAAEGSVNVVLALSLLHLLPNWRDAISRIHGMLKPGGVFISSTPCMNEAASFLRPVARTGHFLGLLPPISFFDRATLETSTTEAGFVVEHTWRPSAKQGVFIVARKSDGAA